MGSSQHWPRSERVFGIVRFAPTQTIGIESLHELDVRPPVAVLAEVAEAR
jgi:hypothetical protein